MTLIYNKSVLKKRVDGLKVGRGIVAPKVSGASPLRPFLNKKEMKEKKIELSKETKKKLEKLGGQINKTMIAMREHDERAKYVTKDTGKGREKYDSGMVRDIREGKGRFDLISPFFLKRIADIYERGAAKYESRNWEKGCSFGRFVDSAFRHFYQYLIGLDDGEDHLGQCVWNIIAIIHFEELIAHGLKPKKLDDLPKYLKKHDLE